MGRKKTLHKGVKWLVLFIQHTAAAVAAIMVIQVLSQLFLTDDIGYSFQRSYLFNMFEQAKNLEDTDLFSEILRSHVDSIVTNVVIGSQIGEDGKYDGNHPVDIVSYADRKNLDEITGEGVEYRLADLLKWYNSGISYTRRYLSGKEEYLLDEIILPIDGISLLERADGSLEKYESLTQALERSVNDLGYNVSYYNERKDKFSEENTNVRYCFVIMDQNGRERVYSNIAITAKDAEEYFRKLGKYAVYDVNTLSFDTNISGLTSAFLQNELDSHRYVYEKASHIYIGVDTAFTADDIYKRADAQMEGMQNIWYFIAAGCAAVLIWVICFAYLSVMAGRKRQPDGQVTAEAEWMDYIPIELYTIVFAGALLLLAALWFEIVYGGGVLLLDEAGEKFQGILVVMVLFGSIMVCGFWYSIVRRFKAHIVWKNSLCGMFLGWIWKGCRVLAGKIKGILMAGYDNAGTIVRIVIPVLTVNFINLLGGFIAYYFFRVTTFPGVLAVVLVVIIDVLFVVMIVKADLCRKKIVEGVVRIREGDMDFQLDTTEMYGENRKLAEAVNSIGNGIKKAVETSMKDERLKADLITNVSHDIKTPLTSIINYVDLLKREQIETEPVKSYIEVLDAKAWRLKQLTDDLVEASKISSGNVVLNFERIKLKELLLQSVGEFSEKFEQKQLTVVENYPEKDIFIKADPARMWRIMENLFNNIYKYSLEGTRVYVELNEDMTKDKGQITLSVKNISKNPLKVSPEELTERFIRGDESRTTEGSGLGLSIAGNLVELQGGKMNIYLDGDLFKVVLTLDAEREE